MVGFDSDPGRSGVSGASASAAGEAALLARLRAGDEGAYRELLETHGGRLLAVARRFMKNDADAEDVLQDGLFSVFKALDTFAGGSQFATWLHRIVVNAALMKLRSRSRKPERSIEELLPRYLEDGHQAQATTWQDDATAAFARTEIRALVREKIDELPESYRVVILLRDIEELSTDETAVALGITPNAVKIRLHRARQALRTLLDPSFAEGAR